ncbi:MAG: UDP-N-acetylmuramoyl-L-alanine--D-glutamate ligase [Desulfuromonadales bacterium]|nr:UDP-N-acetylmuramoyl-L-alanine--D-glutamate ligase [Desulfuromonadales bacterium]
MNYQNQQVVVVGAGKTGLALSDYFLRQGAQVILSDRRSCEQIDAAKELIANGVTLDCGGHDRELFCHADLVVVSPGVPLDLPAIVAAKEAGVRVVGEVEIAYREISAELLIGITGTNGKSTTTSLLGAIFADCGKQTFTGGNLGTPLITAMSDRWDVLTVELSSFQLEAIETFRPHYALLLNLSEDHLDRYPDFAAYVSAKARLFENLHADDVVVYNADDSAVVALLAEVRGSRCPFSGSGVPAGEICIGRDKEMIVWRNGSHEEHFPLRELRLRGAHNVENVMAAMLPPLLEGCPPQQVWATVREFGGLAHRMEYVRELDGVCWYNDSKGTNVGSVVKSLAGLEYPVTLIAGGKDKGGDYGPLLAPLRDCVAHLILIGAATRRMTAELSAATHTLAAADLDEAVRLARALTPVGGTVLLSPGCSSFDMFSGYEERGERFKAAVNALDEQTAGV